MGESALVQLRVPGDLLAKIDEASEGSTRTAWLLSAAEAALLGGRPAAGPEVTTEVPTGGIPSPGVPCIWTGCWSRDTARYGVTDPGELERTDYRERARDENACGGVLCPAHAARLGGLIYRRPVSPPRVGSAA